MDNKSVGSFWGRVKLFPKYGTKHPIFSVETDDSHAGKINCFGLHTCGTALPDSQVNET